MNIIPDRKEFKRADVEKIASLSGKVLDYWETEFAVFFPINKNGEKIYLYNDVEIILKLKQYLTVERLDKAEIREKLSIIDNSQPQNETESKTPVITTKTKTNVEKKIIPNIKKETKTIIDKIKSAKKTTINNKSNNNKLEIIKEDLNSILTILRNNDKNTL